MNKCSAKTEFRLRENIHGRDHSNDLILYRNGKEVFYYRRQDGRVQLMMEFESYHEKFKYISYIGHISIEEFTTNFNF